MPVAAKTALATAGAIVGVPGSPTPVGGLSLILAWASLAIAVLRRR